MTRKSIRRTGLFKTVNILAGFFVLLITVLFSTSITNNVFAAGNHQAGKNDVLSGEVVVVDNLHHMGMLTLLSSEIGQFPNDQLNIFTNKDTSVKICNERAFERDLKVSRNATVTYHEVQGLPLATSISEKC